MAKPTIQNGQAEYGITHVQEDEMRTAGHGVFEEKSGEAGRKKRSARAKADKAPQNKMAAAPTNKASNCEDE